MLEIISRLLKGETIYLKHQEDDDALIKLKPVGDGITLYHALIKRKGREEVSPSDESKTVFDAMLAAEEVSEKEYLKLF